MEKGGEKTMTRLSLSSKHPGKLTKISRDLTEIGHLYECFHDLLGRD